MANLRPGRGIKQGKQFDSELICKEMDDVATSAVLAASEVHELKNAPSVDGVLPAIHERWSARSFDGREVSAATLRKVFEAARWAASSNNEQPWRWVVGRHGDATWGKIYEALAETNRKWAHRAPVLMVGAATTRFSKNGAENRFALYDLGAASSYLTLEAANLGLTTHQMAGFDPEKARELFGVPAEYAMGSVIALGYQGEPAALDDERLIQQETAARTRKALGEVVFSKWERRRSCKDSSQFLVHSYRWTVTR
jgi:nitroreductase